MKRLSKLPLRLVASVALVAGVIGVQAAPSWAATARNGVCEAGEFCYYYGANQTASVSDFTTSVANYGTSQPSCYDFRGAGVGKGVCIKNRAVSVWNRSSQTVRVYYNTNYSGAYQDIKAGAKANLNSTLVRNNASHQFIAANTGRAWGKSSPFNTYPKGQCTWYAAERFHTESGKYPGWSGNAKDWGTNARNAGWTVTNTPSVNAVLVMHGTDGGNKTYGHVAWVTAVTKSGSTTKITIAEMNWLGPNRVDTRTITTVGSWQYILAPHK